MTAIKQAIRKLATNSGFSAIIDRAIVLSVDKNELTCTVQLVADDSELEGVKLKPVYNDADLAKMGLIMFPATGSFVIIGQVDEDNTDLCVLSFSEVESIALDTDTALKLLIGGDGKLSLNTVLTTFNDGKNGGIPLLKPLTKIISDLQQQVNDLSDAFAKHQHPGVSLGGGLTPITKTATPAKATLIKEKDIENKSILQ
ncbi:hypothetical protein [Mucilaginibacter sp. 5C4]|uniref:hypothetical protein n=1 Tax=Mucilaginibacter sp. 5C4 TaxID=3048589 RepID=UPI002AC8DC02|nr:hypothetical protein [Mucilaginibacter sp. 5C4]MEB0302398.1 hypothetical protein [Mucilaginibacter sp. 5C4]WPX22964.1 hypothetical protein RHM67_16915 [Mucilaginibacter sp. 5C4]